jgi:hypothetical protein
VAFLSKLEPIAIGQLRDFPANGITIVSDTEHVTSIGDQPRERKNAVWPDNAPVVATID